MLKALAEENGLDLRLRAGSDWVPAGPSGSNVDHSNTDVTRYGWKCYHKPGGGLGFEGCTRGRIKDYLWCYLNEKEEWQECCVADGNTKAEGACVHGCNWFGSCWNSCFTGY